MGRRVKCRPLDWLQLARVLHYRLRAAAQHRYRHRVQISRWLSLVDKESAVHTETMYDPTTPYVLQNPSSLHLLASDPEQPAAHDPTLLVAALEDLEARRVALEWLLEADLLCVCLV